MSLNPKDVFTHLVKILPFDSDIFMDEWKTMNSRGHLKGLPIQLDE